MLKTKTILLFVLYILIQFSPAICSAQKQEIIQKLFYQLPIDSAGEALIRRIESNAIFSRSKDNTSSTHFGNYYKADIQLSTFPANLPKPEKATLTLEGNVGYDTKSKKDIQSSDITLAYLFSSEELADSYFQNIWKTIKTLSKDTSDAEFGLRDEADFSFGKSVKLRKRKLPEIYLLKRDLSDKQYVLIIYRKEGF